MPTTTRPARAARLARRGPRAPAPAGAVVGIYYDTLAEVAPGHAIVTYSGRTYVVVSARQQLRGKHAGRRWHLRCVVAEGGPPEGVVVHHLLWYKRNRKCT